MLDGAEGISPGDAVHLIQSTANVGVGPDLMGRVIDAAGRPIDELPPIKATSKVPLDNDPVNAMQRPPITDISFNWRARDRYTANAWAGSTYRYLRRFGRR